MSKRSLHPLALPADVTDLVRTIAGAARRARLRRTWTQRLLAEKAGVSEEVVQAVESGKAGTSLGNVLAVLWALRLTAPLRDLGNPATDVEGSALEALEGRQRARRTTRRPIVDTDF